MQKKMVDIDSAAELPTKTDENNTHEHTLDRTDWFRSEEQFAPVLRHFPKSESFILKRHNSVL